ncbi:MAG: hypothetical protein K2K97_11295 [Muribaculaceae bacterium]|nr:hypothetical protein [Muribaculaceae bacterium]
MVFEDIMNKWDLIALNFMELFKYDPSAPMLFSSGLFWILFLIFIPFYAMLKKSRMKMVWLL